MIRAVIFDIEGTIGDIAFVRSVLFPFARERLTAFLTTHWADDRVTALLEQARDIAARPLATASEAVEQFTAWTDEDRKITPLKTLQGLIWRSGYESGVLKAHLYQDAIDAMRRFKAQGLQLYIYSSGSIEAQKLYMAHSIAGDLRPLLSDYFDTTTGAKADPSSYSAIAARIGEPPRNIIFFSDAVPEVEAARTADMSAMLLCRSGQPPSGSLPPGINAITSFSHLERL